MRSLPLRRRFPRRPIDPIFKVCLAFDLPIDLLRGVDTGHMYAYPWKSMGHHAASTVLPIERVQAAMEQTFLDGARP